MSDPMSHERARLEKAEQAIQVREQQIGQFKQKLAELEKLTAIMVNEDEQMRRSRAEIAQLKTHIESLQREQKVFELQKTQATQNIAELKKPRPQVIDLQPQQVSYSASEHVSYAADTQFGMGLGMTGYSSPAPKTPKVEDTPLEAAPFEEPELEDTPLEAASFEEPELEDIPLEAASFEEPELEDIPLEAAPFEEPELEDTPLEAAPFEEPELQDTPLEAAPFEEPELEDTPLIEAEDELSAEQLVANEFATNLAEHFSAYLENRGSDEAVKQVLEDITTMLPKLADALDPERYPDMRDEFERTQRYIDTFVLDCEAFKEGLESGFSQAQGFGDFFSKRVGQLQRQMEPMQNIFGG